MQAKHLLETSFAERGMDHRRKFDHVVASAVSPGASPFGRLQGPWPTEVT
ncbi:MAG: hypothetical protein OXH92_13130 [Bryobacterales bacterium]|nr:hypothetical protein [Bryobacterales bacterium]MDE0294107.1 hypothetical protein [Bryobacterales bacterium]MDE0434939.1 hypothetical protein [Bryobacterales bacterium]